MRWHALNKFRGSVKPYLHSHDNHDNVLEEKNAMTSISSAVVAVYTGLSREIKVEDRKA